MKKLFFLVFLLTIGLSAQSLDFGVKAGPIFNVQDGKVFKAINQEIVKQDGDGKNGFQGGIFLRANLMGFYLQPELLYSTYKNKYEADGESFSVRKKRLDIPVGIGKKFLGIVHLQVGPVFSYFFDDKISLKGISDKDQDDFNVGFHVSGGAKVSNFILDLRYEFGFGKAASEFISDNYEFKTENRPSLLQFTVGYAF